MDFLTMVAVKYTEQICQMQICWGDTQTGRVLIRLIINLWW